MQTIELPHLEIMDTTLRDGLQSPEGPNHGKYTLSLDERLEIFQALIKYGIKHFEVFSPSISSFEADALAAYLEIRDQLASQYGRASIHVHVRAHVGDVDAALKIKHHGIGVDGLNMYMGTSPFSTHANHRKNLHQVAMISSELLKSIRHAHPQLELRFSGEDAFRTELPDLYTVFDEVAPYVDLLGIPDTFGHALPTEVAERVRALIARYGLGEHPIQLEGHFHNDLQLSMANAMMGMLSGMTRIDTSILGLAERSGITSLTGLLYLLYAKFPQFPDLTAPYQLQDSYALNILVASLLNLQVEDPVSLTSATHTAGVHGAAVLRDPSTYQDPNLAKFGVDGSKILLGPYSGWNVIEYFLGKILYFQNVTEEVAKQLTPIFKERCAQIPADCHPKELLQQIALEFSLTQMLPPPTHQEII